MPIAKIFASDARPMPVVRRKRTDLIAEAIKQMIVEQRLGPGDRLPQEKELMAQFSAGKSTVREALKALEVQGLISVRTGPGGGPFIARMSEGRAMSLLSNFLFAKDLTMAHAQAMRAALEPLAAVSAIGHIDEAGFRQLNAILAGSENPELDFFGVVAGYSDNPMLAFTCRFLQRLIRESEQGGSASPGAPAPLLRELLVALRQKDDAAVRALLTRYFADFKGGETPVMERFLVEPDLPNRARRRHGN